MILSNLVIHVGFSLSLLLMRFESYAIVNDMCIRLKLYLSFEAYKSEIMANTDHRVVNLTGKVVLGLCHKH